MNKLMLYSLSSFALTLASCATGGNPLAGQYAMGSDTRAVQEGRNRTVLTNSEYQQHRRQRADVSEEMDLDEKKRRASLSPLRTAAEGASLVRSFTGFLR